MKKASVVLALAGACSGAVGTASGTGRGSGGVRDDAGAGTNCRRADRSVKWGWRRRGTGRARCGRTTIRATAPTLYQLDRAGAVSASVTLNARGTLDIEDVCSFEWNGVPQLAVADTGDNRRKRASVSVMLLEEPEPRPGQNLRRYSVSRRIYFTYADGPQDCESIAFDPETRSLLLVTKSWPDMETLSVPPAGLYVLPLDGGVKDDSGDPVDAEVNAAADADGTAAAPRVLQRVADLTLKVTTAADVSPDGRRLMVLTYGDAYQYVRAEGQTWAEAVAVSPTRVALGPRGQSEGLCFGRDGRTLWISSEGLNQPLYRVSPR